MGVAGRLFPPPAGVSRRTVPACGAALCCAAHLLSSIALRCATLGPRPHPLTDSVRRGCQSGASHHAPLRSARCAALHPRPPHQPPLTDSVM